MAPRLLLLLLSVCAVGLAVLSREGVAGAGGGRFTLVNKCREVVWMGTQGSVVLSGGGLELAPGAAVAVSAPAGWHGRFWGRTGCRFDATGRGRCETGDCGGAAKCAGAGGQPPATLAEFSLGANDFYDVSLVDGYNVQVSVVPRGGRRGDGGAGECRRAGCDVDVNAVRPAALRMMGSGGRRGGVVACRSACNAFAQPRFCCTGAYGSPATCRASAFSRVFKHACPAAYSFAYDDPSSIFTCASPTSYVITFCG